MRCKRDGNNLRYAFIKHRTGNISCAVFLYATGFRLNKNSGECKLFYACDARSAAARLDLIRRETIRTGNQGSIIKIFIAHHLYLLHDYAYGERLTVLGLIISIAKEEDVNGLRVYDLDSVIKSTRNVLLDSN